MSNKSQRQLVDDRLEALGRYERRCLLLQLSTLNSPEDSAIDFSDLECTGSELDPLVAMRQLHLPYLEERGFVRWDRKKQTVSKGPRFGEVEPLLNLLRDIQDELPGRWT